MTRNRRRRRTLVLVDPADLAQLLYDCGWKIKRSRKGSGFDLRGPKGEEATYLSEAAQIELKLGHLARHEG